MRRLALLIAVGALWLFLAALPALADGGPHVADTNSGVSTLTADGCASCHRAHTAQASYLLVSEVPDLCLNCHGSAGVGATTDVENGVQYRSTAASAQDPDDPDVVLGALRNGGFLFARINSDDPARLAYLRSATDVSFRSKVGADSTSSPVTSVHMDIENPGSSTVWGSGLVSGTASVGGTMTLECTNCHNPHGNNQFRILRPIPTGSFAASIESTTTAPDPVVTTITGLNAQNDALVTSAANHGLRIGTIVKIAGYTGTAAPTVKTVTAVNAAGDYLQTGTTDHNLGAGSIVTISGLGAVGVPDDTYVVRARVSGTRFSLNVPGTSTLLEIPADASGLTGTVTTQANVTALDGIWTIGGVPALNQITLVGLSVNSTENVTGTPTATQIVDVDVTDAPLPAADDARNYTILQTMGTQGTDATFMLYASDVEDGRLDDTFNGISGTYDATGGDYFRRAVPWNPSITDPTCDPTVFSTANSLACTTMQDAPNGRPAGGVFNDEIQVAFNDQINAWCVQCHTRYYGGRTADPASTTGGSGSAWQYPSGDAIYAYRHTTASNRVCTTCHVGHGSNAVMTGEAQIPYPGQSVDSASSRLLKVDDRGTCQLCHDPTETTDAGQYLYYSGGVIAQDDAAPWDGMKSVP